MAPSTDRSHRPLIALLGALILVPTLAACGGSAGTATTGSSVASDQLQGIQRDRPMEVGSVVLPQVGVGEADVPFTMKARAGGLLFVYFGYTNCPDLCPTTFSDLRQALDQLGPDGVDRVDAAFVTVDPERDTPEVLQRYLRAFIRNGHDHPIRTTDPAALQQAEDAFLASSTVTKKADGEIEVSHTAISTIVDAEGNVLVQWPFGFSPDAMAHDLRILLDRVARQSPDTTASTTANPNTSQGA